MRRNVDLNGLGEKEESVQREGDAEPTVVKRPPKVRVNEGDAW